MNFKEYEKARLDEEIKNGKYLPDELERVEVQKANSDSAMVNLIAKYFEKGKTGKVSMVGFGSDISEGINDFVLNKLVDIESDFENVDKVEAYKKAVRDKLTEKALPKLKAEFESIGMIINGLLTDYTKKI